MTASCTNTRFGETQIWPELANFSSAISCAAVATSASSKTMTGALPPSSSENFFTEELESSTSRRPVSEDTELRDPEGPVNLSSTGHSRSQ